MAKNSRGKYYAKYISKYTQKNYALIILGSLFLSGVLTGTIIINSAGEQTADFLVDIVKTFVKAKESQSFSELFVSAAVSPLVFVLLLFVCGFCGVFQPIEAVLVFLRGVGFGAMASVLYSVYGTNAAAYIFVYILPGMLVSTLAILFCCREALRFSGKVFWGIIGKETEKYPLRIYMARFLMAGIVCVFSAFIDAVLFTMFEKFIILG